MEEKEEKVKNTPANFVPRIVWGAIILVVLVGFFALRILSTYVFDVLLAGLIIVSALEVENVLHKMNRPTHTVAVAFYPILCFIMVVISANADMSAWVALLLMIVSMIVLGLIIFAWPLIFVKYGKVSKERDGFEGSILQYAFSKMLNTLFVCLWPTLFFSFTFMLNHYDLLSNSSYIEAFCTSEMGVDFGLLALVFLFATTMASDTCAMLSGRFIGGPKISLTKLGPGKSWTGLVGGIVGATLMGMIIYFIFNAFYGYSALFSSLHYSVWTFILGGFFAGIFNMAGDIFSSFFKRRAVVKDFSQLIPGHGGVMDRCNGLLVNSVFVFVFFIILFG